MKSLMILTTLILLISTPLFNQAAAQKFIHPGIDMTSDDLEYMKKQVLAGVQPWKDAFDSLKTKTDLNYIVKPFTHIQRGAYGRPNIGGAEIVSSSNLAYDCAILWYITKNKAYADKANEILNAWSSVLWDFDYNDSKLLAGWTGYLLCNAAEILRSEKTVWHQKDIDSFTNMMMTVYYPLLRYYKPEANGNWDGAIIHSIMAIAIFTDNHEMFNNALDHFLHGPLNGSIFKYIYPSGQCQESTRDQGHVQLGLGEFAGAARVAYTQGIDLFSIANNRIALGFEYTAGFLYGEKPHSYGPISEIRKTYRDVDYQYVYNHYTSKGISMPYSKIAADSVSLRSPRNTLTAFRATDGRTVQMNVLPKASTIGYPAGAMATATSKVPEGSVYVNPGESLQEALDGAAGTGRWIVAKSGIHTLPATLKMPGGVTLAGEGLGTVLFLDPASGARESIVNKDNDLHDITIRDLVIEGALQTNLHTDPNARRSFRSDQGNRGGIMFLAQKEGQIKDINLINLTVRNCTYNGVFINGSDNVNIICCDFNESGSNVVPGPKLVHNLLLTRCTGINVKDSRLVTSPYGSGIALAHCRDAKIDNCEVARNGYYGILVSESENVSVTGSLIEANDRSGIMFEFLFKGSENITVTNNHIQYNNGYGVESYSARKINVLNNNYEGNGNTETQQKISADKFIIMQ